MNAASWGNSCLLGEKGLHGVIHDPFRKSRSLEWLLADPGAGLGKLPRLGSRSIPPAWWIGRESRGEGEEEVGPRTCWGRERRLEVEQATPRQPWGSGEQIEGPMGACTGAERWAQGQNLLSQAPCQKNIASALPPCKPTLFPVCTSGGRVLKRWRGGPPSSSAGKFLEGSDGKQPGPELERSWRGDGAEGRTSGEKLLAEDEWGETNRGC